MKHIHFIGICGVGMSALAILWKKKGWKVTGSDVGFYPPISTHLKKHGIEFYPGWHPERIGGCHVERSETSPESKGILRSAQDDKKGGKTTKPDLVVVGNVAGGENPEWKFTRENKIPYVSYPELIAQNLVKKNSIVCAGTYGKTSTAALLTWILSNAGYNPTYMFGGLALDMEESADDPDDGDSHPPPPAGGPLKGGFVTATPNPLHGENDENPPSEEGSRGGVSRWSILEGDEYKTSRWDERAKFFSYRPTHLLLTAVEWDHADVYPTERSYVEAFQKLVEGMPKDGMIVISEKACRVMLSEVPTKSGRAKHPPPPGGSFANAQDDNIKILRYGKSDGADYRYTDVRQTKNGLTFNIINKNQTYEITAPLIGAYNAENICGAFALAKEIGVAPAAIIEAIKNFHGLKRRLEKRGQINGADIYDDIAHSPAKAKSALATLRNIYCHVERSPEPENLSSGRSEISPRKQGDSSASPQNDRRKIFAVFEPNTGNRQPAALPQYDGAFAAADAVLIPRLTKIKTSTNQLQETKGLPRPPAGGLAMTNTPIDGPELARVIAQTHADARYFESDEELINFLKQKTRPGDAVAFLGSHSFRGMIEELVTEKII